MCIRDRNNYEECISALKKFDGVMVGRAVYSNPLIWQKTDAILFGEKEKEISASQVLKGLIPYAQKHLLRNGRLWDICKHTLQLVQGVKGARRWRKEMTEQAQNNKADVIILENAARQLEDAGL